MIENTRTTDEQVNGMSSLKYWIKEHIFLGQSLPEYIRGLITPFNIVVGAIILAGLVLLVVRFSQGLGAVTSGIQEQPWGLFLSWGLFSGVPMSATGFILGLAVYIFGLKQYRYVVDNAILVGFLGYLFAVIFLLIDLGRPWRLPYPMVVSFGTASVLFLVAWHVALYLTCQFLEISPRIFEWGGWKTLRRGAIAITIGLTIFGVILSTLHQSALGGMFLLTPGKLHPLWYSPYIPIMFLVSAVAAGLSMVIFVSFMTKIFFKKQADSAYLQNIDNITLGLGKAAAFVLITYLGLKVISVAHGNSWGLLDSTFGYWFLVEVLGFVLLPCILFVYAIRREKVGLVRFAAILTILGVIINRLNTSLIALNWNLPERELFGWKELVIVVAVICVEIVVYRWIINRMPILREHTDFKEE
jgi:Ni/Fe-hydrogenase subunit HybB-like protein